MANRVKMAESRGILTLRARAVTRSVRDSHPRFTGPAFRRPVPPLRRPPLFVEAAAPPGPRESCCQGFVRGVL